MSASPNALKASLFIDGQPVEFTPGQTILQAALEAGIFIPHLCHHPQFKPHGSCKLCMVTVNGRSGSACTTPALPGQEVENNTPEINGKRRVLLQMLFIEGNHFCPACEKSGNCQLQALAYELEMVSPHFPHFYPTREVDASHPDLLLNRDRCIQCELCVRASRDVDGKNVFSMVGRGLAARLVVNSPSGALGDSDFAITDKAANVCPVGALLKKHIGYAVPIGARRYDRDPISAQVQFLATKEA